MLREEQIFHRVEEISVLGRPGSDLLFQALRLSTIGAGEFNGRVRDGIGYRLPANTTRSAKDGNRTCCADGRKAAAQKSMKHAGISHAFRTRAAQFQLVSRIDAH